MSKHKIDCCRTSEQLHKCEHEHKNSVAPHEHACGCDSAHKPEHTHNGCGCEHSHGGSSWVLWLRMGAAAAMLAAALIYDGNAVQHYALVAAAWLCAAYDLALSMFKNIAKGRVFNENLLMVVASSGAVAIGEPFEGLAVVILYQIGEWFQHRAVDRSRASIADMMELRPERANLLSGGVVETVDASALREGDLVLVRAGERVPADCEIEQGGASFDTSSLTGESVPRDASVGDLLLAGFYNLNGPVTCRVLRPSDDSAAARVVELLRQTERNKAHGEAFITKFARVYTPIVCALALLICAVPTLMFGREFAEQLRVALTFLVVSCPCALVLSVPLTFFAGIGAAARRGVMVKGGGVLETLSAKNLSIAFDKTGTLTMGRFAVSGIYPINGVSDDALLAAAALAERGSSHPIAATIAAAVPDDGRTVNAEEMAGYGVRAIDGERTILAGNARLMEREGVPHTVYDGAGSVVHVAENGRYLGFISVEDSLKPDAKSAIDRLRRMGVRSITMLTGDARASADSAAKRLGIDDCRAELLPGGKTDELATLDGTVVFVGDGINDAPSLALADVGIAMADGTNRIAADAADAVIMGASPMRVADAIAVSRKTRRIVRQNVVGALVLKVAVLILAALGLTNMLVAVLADVGVTLVAVLNALRVMRREKH